MTFAEEFVDANSHVVGAAAGALVGVVLAGGIGAAVGTAVGGVAGGALGVALRRGRSGPLFVSQGSTE